jgi:hypothetical protein
MEIGRRYFLEESIPASPKDTMICMCMKKLKIENKEP